MYGPLLIPPIFHGSNVELTAATSSGVARDREDVISTFQELVVYWRLPESELVLRAQEREGQRTWRQTGGQHRSLVIA